MKTTLRKTPLLVLSLLAAMAFSQSASADGRYFGRGFYDYGYGNHFGYGNRYGFNRHRGSSVNVFVGRNWGYGPRYNRWGRGIGYPYRHGYRRWDAADFVGGLVLGSVLNASLNTPRYSERVVTTRPVTRTREVVYVNEPRTVVRSRSQARPVGRSLLLDREGNCFERVVEENGDEIRVQLDPSECNF